MSQKGITMLDLNLGIIFCDSSCDEDINNNDDNQNNMVKEKLEYLPGTQMEEDSTGTSNSSIIITEEGLTNPGEENSSNNTSAFIFDILKKENNDANTTINAFKETSPNHDFTVHQLFPEKTGLELNLESGFHPITAPTTRPQWLKLSQVESSGEAELRIVQQKQQQVRKSRRGPRSRSSEYRGVTFYRRTGRWESHIWWVEMDLQDLLFFYSNLVMLIFLYTCLMIALIGRFICYNCTL